MGLKLTDIEKLFNDHGHIEYAGEGVSQLEHALQAAHAAEREGATPELVTAALLHDLGHMLNRHGETPTARGIDRRIDPSDRRCYAFFHPALVDEPLIFVEVKD